MVTGGNCAVMSQRCKKTVDFINLLTKAVFRTAPMTTNQQNTQYAIHTGGQSASMAGRLAS